MLKSSWLNKIVFLIVFSAFLFPQAALAGNLCYCNWYDPSQHFSDMCSINGVIHESVASAEKCEENCISAHGSEYYLSSEFVEDTSSAIGEAVADICTEMVAEATTEPDESATSTREVIESVKPELAVKISGIIFSDLYEEDGKIRITWLGEYIQGVYTYLLGAALAIAIVLVMARGVQYVLAAGGASTQKAMEKIKAAAMGIVLLLSVTTILYIVNPQLTDLDSIILDTVEMVEIGLATRGPGGSGNTAGGGIADLPYPYSAIYEDAQQFGACGMDPGEYMLSPTGGGPNYGEHHWFDRGENGKWENINNMDWGSAFGGVIYAPFSGTVTYLEAPEPSCGNLIKLDGSGASISICHAKDFIGADGTYKKTRTVVAGEVIGHSGGRCCSGDTSVTKDYICDRSAEVGMVRCTDPKKSEECECQYTRHSGNTSGPHVHVTWKNQSETHALLACMQDSSTMTLTPALCEQEQTSCCDASGVCYDDTGTIILSEQSEEGEEEEPAEYCEDLYELELDYVSCCDASGDCYDASGGIML
jgi:hypothetical protein